MMIFDLRSILAVVGIWAVPFLTGTLAMVSPVVFFNSIVPLGIGPCWSDTGTFCMSPPTIAHAAPEHATRPATAAAATANLKPRIFAPT